MWQSACLYRIGIIRFFVLGLMVFGLAGCASTISARVTSYQQWPVDTANAKYRIVATPEQQGTLEFQAFSDMVRAAMGPTGLVESVADQAVRFEVQLKYENPRDHTWVQRYQDPYFGGWGFSPYFGGFYGGHGGWGWGSGVYMGPSVTNIPVDVYRNRLTVTIRDKQNHGIQVYQSSAVSVSKDDNLAGIMPYLAQAVFDGFPGNNGEVRVVRYDRPRQ